MKLKLQLNLQNVIMLQNVIRAHTSGVAVIGMNEIETSVALYKPVDREGIRDYLQQKYHGK